ncbi:type 1 fimbrial protein [Providencia stuartii]|uniref:hypothetical protein n=1 Tax=Providencia TaxID=586 RepID=UPI0004F60484|nr:MULTISPECIES: hypothetical protein [Providencia]AIN65203.1 hypothetical protein DR96_3906 [Providencia stuartii]KNZ82526.1 fimbrial protein [Providencia stuartii]MBG5895346.1 type 1 fimbrial protein [Providencia stuartii]MBK1421188.1 type 1 fimbrial protein [Providencia stuartii]MBN5556060.1 type 1 fimbrial protein [Providencia stuartii]
MKNTIKYLGLLPLLAVSFSYADTNANLKVSGDIKPPTCMVNGEEQTNIIYDMGKLSVDVIPMSSMYIFPENSKVKNTVTVTCDAQTYLIFMATDTYQGLSLPSTPVSSSYSHKYFHINGGKPAALGGVSFLVKDAKVDNNSGYVRRLYNSTHATSRLGDYVLTKGEYYGWSNTKHEAGDKDAFMQSLIPGKVFSASFEQDSVFINSRDDLAKANIELNDELNYNAEAVITFSFSL